MINQEDKELIRQELLAESKQEELEESKMYSDQEYAIEQYADEIISASETLKDIASRLNNYNHYIDYRELLDYV